MSVDDYQLLLGDCFEVLKTLEPDCVDAIVTDPPYGLGFMGKHWDHAVPSAEVWAECLRVLKPGGHLLAFAGTRTQHRMACAIEDAGFEIRDMIAWVYGKGFPKSLDVSKAIDKAAGAEREVVGQKWADRYPNGPGANSFSVGEQPDGKRTAANSLATAPATEAAKQWEGWGTALKPALEPITVARKPLIGTVAGNVLAHGTGGINVDGCRVPCEQEVIEQSGELVDIKRGKGAEGSEGWHSRMFPMGKPKERGGPAVPAGRWPANLIHDGSEGVLELLGDAARFFYSAKASKADRNDGLSELAEKRMGFSNGAQAHGDGYDKGQDIGLNRVISRKNHHPTVKPTALMCYLCRLVTPPGGLVLDPFMGSGSTGRGAILEGFRFLGIELEAEYLEVADKRIRAAVQQRAEEQQRLQPGLFPLGEHQGDDDL